MHAYTLQLSLNKPTSTKPVYLKSQAGNCAPPQGYRTQQLVGSRSYNSTRPPGAVYTSFTSSTHTHRTVPSSNPACVKCRAAARSRVSHLTHTVKSAGIPGYLLTESSQPIYQNSRNSRTRRKGYITGPRRIVPTMVEGHQCHRVGAAHRRLLLGKAFDASSPNGRFIEGAAAITGKLLTRIEVHGKNLFYFFSGSSSSAGGSSAAAAAAAAAAGNNTVNSVVLTSADIDPLADPDDSASEDLIIPPAAAAAAAASPAVPPRTPARSSGTSRSLPPNQAPAVTTTNPNPPTTPSLLRSAGSAAAAALAGSSTGNNNNNNNDTDNNSTVVVHIHFGMSGAFRTALLPGPSPTPTTRLRLEHQATGLMAHLSAMTVAHGAPGFYQDKVIKLGPDPLRSDDDPERFWLRVSSSKKPIGLLLMDQSAVAGVGNIYRAEILYKSRLHPEQPSYSLTRQHFDTLWHHCVECLQRGFTSGSILTVDPEDARILGKPWTRRYIYNQRSCGRCKGPVKSWGMAGRTVYCCETCQPLQLNIITTAAAAGPTTKKSRKRKTAASSSDTEDLAPTAAAAAAAAEIVLSPHRLKSMAAAKQAKEFVSHCAPDDPADLQPPKMTCAQLRQQLVSLNLNTRGNKPVLVARLEQGLIWAATKDQDQVIDRDGDQDQEYDKDLGQDQAAAAAGSSESEDEVDKAEDKLAKNLSVPAAKRGRRPSAAAAAAAGGPATPDPPKRRRRATAAAAAAADMASATAAAAEKAAAGENRAVEHVALHVDEATEALMCGSQQQQQPQQQQRVTRRSRSNRAN